MKIFEWFVRTLYWLQVFAAPVVLFGLMPLVFMVRPITKLLH